METTGEWIRERVEITAAYPAGKVGDTAENLAAAGVGEIGLVVAVLFFLLLRQVLAIGEDRSWPPPTDAITAATSASHAACTMSAVCSAATR